jgi:hypothetical protein
MVVAFEAGRDGFWLARWLRARGIEAYVIHGPRARHERVAPHRCRARPHARCGSARSPPHRPVPGATADASPTHSSRWGRHQQPTHGGDRVVRLVIAHEPEPFGGIAFVSRANQAAAFESISRSSRSWRFSRRKRSSSARSASATHIAAARIASSLRHPVPDRLRGRFKLTHQFLRRTAGMHQLDHLATKLRRIG